MGNGGLTSVGWDQGSVGWEMGTCPFGALTATFVIRWLLLSAATGQGPVQPHILADVGPSRAFPFLVLLYAD